MYRASFRRKTSAVPLCKSIESAIQWFQIHHGITFVTIHNPAVYLSGARVSISPTLVPRLLGIGCFQNSQELYHLMYRKPGLFISKLFCQLHRVTFDRFRLYEPRCEKTGFLHMRKQRRRSASR